MPEPNADALIEQLQRACRRWKRLALGALVVFVIVVAGLAAVTARQISRERAIAQAARAEAEQAQQRAEQLLYIANIQLAQRAFAEQPREGKKP
jgi:hypothetical protein